MKCPIKGCKASADSDTKMYQHVNKMHQGSSYKPKYEYKTEENKYEKEDVEEKEDPGPKKKDKWESI